MSKNQFKEWVKAIGAIVLMLVCMFVVGYGTYWFFVDTARAIIH